MIENDFWKMLVHDVQIELTDEFDKNFERKAFFDQPWPETKWPNNKGSLMNRTGALRRSIAAAEEPGQIRWTSSLPYAEIQNEGGEITVTLAMKKFFWAMFYKASGAVTKTAGGKASASQRNVRLSQEAMIWKSLALMKVGEKMHIPRRRFLGNHPQVGIAVNRAAEKYMYELSLDIENKLNP